VQHVLRAIRGPHGQKVVIGVCEGAAATDRDEPGVGHVAEDHCFRTRTPWLRRGLRSGLTWRSIRAGAYSVMSVIGVKRHPPGGGRGVIKDALAANPTLLGSIVMLRWRMGAIQA
jgi:hypothetical protein